MYISKIYLQDNFVPDPMFDQFRRRVIGTEITMKEGDDILEAEAKGEAYMKDYIKRNSSQPAPQQECRGVEERIVEKGTPHPITEQIRVAEVQPLTKEQKTQAMIDNCIALVKICKSERELKFQEKAVERYANPELTEAYNNKLSELQKQPA